jgi:hypothetical protein
MPIKCENCECEEVCEKYDIKSGAVHPCKMFRPRQDKKGGK